MKVVDGFIFFNEFELLELRLKVLEKTVDFHILVESNVTSTGKPKPYFFEENKGRFAEWADRIRHVKITQGENEDPSIVVREHAQAREHEQRNLIMNGTTGMTSEDWLIVSDVDEIPRPEIVDVASRMDGKPVSFIQDLHYYWLNLKQAQRWYGSVMCRLGYMRTPQHIRHGRWGNAGFENAGWHFSFLGGEDAIRAKLSSYSESQTCTPERLSRDFIRRCLETGEDLFGRTGAQYQKTFVEIDGAYPECIGEFISKYPHLVHEA